MGLTISLLHVRRSAFINESADVVWRHLENFERLNEWFGIGHQLEVYEPHLHGRVELSVGEGSERMGFGGPIVVFEAGRELSFEDNWFGANAWPVPTFITIRLTPLYEGTMVEIIHHGFERLGKEAGTQLGGYEAGWDNKHLVQLKALVEATE